ncbi:MAG: chemotaxis protein CheW [Leptonema sp. (in: bacteria)]
MGTEILNKYVIFTLDEEEYGFDVLKILEIMRLDNLIDIPHSKDYFMGMVDVRGKVIPVIDFKKKLQIQQETSAKPDKLIIVEIHNKKIGLAVDNVLSVMDFAPEEIDLGPPAVKSFHTKYILGIGKKQDKLIILINLANVFTESEIQALNV